MNNINQYKVDNTKNQFHDENFRETLNGDVEEFRRKTPKNRFSDEKSVESSPNNTGSKSTKKYNGWGTDLDTSSVVKPEVNKQLTGSKQTAVCSPVLAKCEPCNYTGKSKSALYQHKQGQRHKNNMNNLTQSTVSQNFKIHFLIFFPREITHCIITNNIALFFSIFRN